MSFSLVFALALGTPPDVPLPAVTGLTHELSSPNKVTRSRAAKELGKFEHQAAAAVPVLVRTLADADPFGPRRAAEGRRKIRPAGGPGPREALNSGEARVAIRVLETLRKVWPKDHPTVITLARTLKEDPD